MPEKKNTIPDAGKPVTLKILAEYLDLAPATASILLNNSPIAKPIALAQLLLAPKELYPEEVHFEPNLAVRESTSTIHQAPPSRMRRARS